MFYSYVVCLTGMNWVTLAVKKDMVEKRLVQNSCEMKHRGNLILLIFMHGSIGWMDPPR